MAEILFIGAFFFLAMSTIGLLKMPDVYTRIHASGVGDTLGMALAILGFLFLPQTNALRLKLVLVLVMFMIINPTITHFVGKVSLIHGVWPSETKKHKVRRGNHGLGIR